METPTDPTIAEQIAVLMAQLGFDERRALCKQHYKANKAELLARGRHAIASRWRKRDAKVAMEAARREAAAARRSAAA